MTAASNNTLNDRAKLEVDAGRLWRAKEILSGNIGIQKFNVELYQQYGELLLRMGDLVEAGKFLFLSGQRKPEYDEAIDLFIKRFTKKNNRDLYYVFPRRAQFETLDKYPEQTKKDLEAFGFQIPAKNPQIEAQPKNKLGSFFGITFAVFIVILLFVGFVVVGELIITFIKNMIF